MLEIYILQGFYNLDKIMDFKRKKFAGKHNFLVHLVQELQNGRCRMHVCTLRGHVSLIMLCSTTKFSMTNWWNLALKYHLILKKYEPLLFQQTLSFIIDQIFYVIILTFNRNLWYDVILLPPPMKVCTRAKYWSWWHYAL